MAEVQWYYARNDQQFGPVSAAELKQLADTGRLAPDDLLWREGMDSWATAINLRGLFGDESEPAVPVVSQSPDQSPSAAAPSVKHPPTLPAKLGGVLRATQIILWTTCVFVVLVGMVLFTMAFLKAETAGDEAAAAAVFSTFFIGAYVLARCGEKLSRLL